LTPEDFLARLAVAVFDLVGLVFVFLFLGIAAVYHRDQPAVSEVSDEFIGRGTPIVIYSGLRCFRRLALQTQIRAERLLVIS